MIDWVKRRKWQADRNVYFMRQLHSMVSERDKARAFVDGVLSTGIVPVEMEATRCLVEHIKELRAEVRMLRAQLDEAKAGGDKCSVTS